MNTNDPKFASLRKKLDQFGYTQTLNPDSLELVSRLFRDQMQVLAQIEKEKKKNKSESSIDKSNSMVSTLYAQIDKLTLEKEALEKQLEQARAGSFSREPDERTLKLQSHVNDLRLKLEESIKNFAYERQELENQLAELRHEKGQLLNDNQRLKNASSNSLSKLEEQNHELTLLLERKNKDIKSLEESNGKSRIKLQLLEKTIQELRNNSKDVREENKNQSGRMMTVLKQELAESESRFRQTKTELEDTHEQLDGLRRELRRSKDQIASLRSDQTKNRNLDTISKAGLEKFESKLQEARLQLSDCNEEIRRLKEQLSGSDSIQEKLNNKIKELNNKIKFLTDQNNDLQSQIQLISGKLTTNVKRVRELENISSSYQKQLKEALETGKTASLEKLQGIVEEERTKAEQLRKDIVLNERQYKLLQEEVKILREQAEQRTIERDRALVENKKLLTIISEGSKNLQVLQFQKQELMKENRQLKTGKQQIASSDYAAKSELFMLKEKNQSLQVQLEELRGVIHGSQSTNAQIESELAKMQSLLNQSEQKNREVFEDNRLMLGQLKILEQRKNELHEKVRELQERQQLKNDNTTVARKEFDRLVVQYQQLQAQLAKKDQAIRLIDSERDELQNILDQQTEEKARLQDELESIKRQTRKYGKEIDQRQYNLNDLKVKISRIESERDDLDKQLHRQCEQSIELKDRLNMTEVSNRELHNEVNNLAISNKQNEREVERSRIRVAELDRKLKERIKDYEEERERATALNILNNELHLEMEQQRGEIIRLQGLLRELEEANNSMYHHLQQKDHELDHYGHLIEDMQKQENQYRLEIESYQRQLENITQDYEFSKNELKQLSGDRQALRAQRNWKKEISSQSDDWRSKQEQRYLQLQQDYDKKKYEIEQLRQKNRQLESLLGEERSKNFRMSRQMESMQMTPTKSVLIESRVERYQSQNENISNVHSRLRNQSLQNSRDDISEPESIHSAMQKIRRIEEMYMQTTKPNMRL